MWLIPFIAIQNPIAYRKMKKIYDELSIQVDHVLAEPIGSYIWNHFREFKDNNPNIFGALPDCLQVEIVFDLGAGM